MPFLRPLSNRATSADLWAGVEALAVGGRAATRASKRLGTHPTSADWLRYAAFVEQARQYYEAARSVSPVAKPLLGYYFALNVSKAYLTVVDPASTRARLTHGLAEAREEKRRYFFQQEAFRIQEKGVFRLLAANTGMHWCYAAGKVIPLVKLLPYLCEGYDLYSDVAEDAPKLLPLTSAKVLFRKNEGWIRAEVDRNVPRQRHVGPEALVRRARIFGNHFRLVQSDEVGCV